MADAALADVLGRDAAQLGMRAGVEAVQRLGVAAGHELVVGEGEREHRHRQRGVLRAQRVAALAHHVFAVQAPAAPLRHHAAREVADLAQLAAGEVAEEGQRERDDDVPEPPDVAAQADRVLAPVAAAAAHGHRAGDARAVGQQAQDLAAQAVAEPVDLAVVAQQLVEMRERRGGVMLGPGADVGVEAAQRALHRLGTRGTHAAVIEAQHQPALRRHPAREGGVVALLDAHGGGDQQARLGRRRVAVEMALELESVVRLETDHHDLPSPKTLTPALSRKRERE